MPNRLTNSTSTYLLQHAHQPVDWHPWGEEALRQALHQDKPLLVSIGYAACHWCHVMAQACFEDDGIAALMNAHFVCVKVDREERPDVDQVHVAALQAMGLPVGWPLHAFLLPDQRPFYGGLYFAPDAWRGVLTSVAQAFRRHRTQLAASAAQFVQAIRAQHAASDPAQRPELTQRQLQGLWQKIATQLDDHHGGVRGAPKFPMPSLGQFVLHYHRLTRDGQALAHLHRHLHGMACGGIYDHLGGGFMRYATDDAWRFPHFEKMLCDNGLLLSLYAQTHAISPRPLYQRVIRETATFVEQTMMLPTGGFCSALDADSEGTEGKFYTWTRAEVEAAAGSAALPLMAHFHITAAGNWQPGANVLYATVGHPTSAQIMRGLRKLRQQRAHRKPPARDDKIVAAWNAMVMQGLLDAYWAVGEERWLNLALKTARFIEQQLLQGHRLWHSCSQGRPGAWGYLEDYAWVARAFISLHQATLQEHWLRTAQGLVQYALDHFCDAQGSTLYTAEDQAPALIVRPSEWWDGALPSASAVMAHNLHCLGTLLGQPAYAAAAQRLSASAAQRLHEAPLYMTHWATLAIRQSRPMPVVTTAGPQALAHARVLKQHYPLDLLVTGTRQPSTDTTLRVCCGDSCQAPTHDVQTALRFLLNLGIS